MADCQQKSTRNLRKNTDGFTESQQRLIDAYEGDLKAAAAAAGVSHQYARHLATRPNFLKALRARDAARYTPNIAQREERASILSDIVRDPKQKTADRIRAAELLARMGGEFTAQVDERTGRTLADLIAALRPARRVDAVEQDGRSSPPALRPAQSEQ